MTVKIEAQGPVIMRWFSGPTTVSDVIDSWEELFKRYEDMAEYDGVLSSYKNANLIDDRENMNEVVEYLRSNLTRLSDMKLAFVMDRPIITNTMIIDQEHHRAEIKQFKSEKKAFDWIQGKP